MTTPTSSTPTPDEDGPRAWVGCLACYNGGDLRGDWVQGDTADEFTPCGRPDHEEWWVFDHDGYDGLLTGECSPHEAARLGELHAALVARDVPVSLFVQWCDNDGTTPSLDVLDRWDDAYLGTYADLDEWAWEYLDDAGMLAQLPEWAQTHAGALVSSWARDARIGGDVWTVEGFGAVHVFRGGV